MMGTMLSQFEVLCAVIFSDPINNSQLDGLVILPNSFLGHCWVVFSSTISSHPHLICIRIRNPHPHSTFIHPSLLPH